jgi:hypothetical protein
MKFDINVYVITSFLAHSDKFKEQTSLVLRTYSLLIKYGNPGFIHGTPVDFLLKILPATSYSSPLAAKPQLQKYSLNTFDLFRKRAVVVEAFMNSILMIWDG